MVTSKGELSGVLTNKDVIQAHRQDHERRSGSPGSSGTSPSS